MLASVLPLGSHAHLAEPGCLYTKQALWARLELVVERPFLIASGVGTRNPTWTFMRKGLEFAPQQMPSTQSQLGGLVEGRQKTRWKIAWVRLELKRPQAPEPRTPPTHTHNFSLTTEGWLYASQPKVSKACHHSFSHQSHDSLHSTGLQFSLTFCLILEIPSYEQISIYHNNTYSTYHFMHHLTCGKAMNSSAYGWFIINHHFRLCS